MNKFDILQLIVFFALLIGLTPILGNYMADVFLGKKHILKPIFGWFERWIYRFCRIDSNDEYNWKIYLRDLLIFNFIGAFLIFLMQFFQSYFPLNPSAAGNVSWHSSFNTAVSFMTNTNWQGYAGETTLGNFVQMFGLTVQNFLSAATGIAVLLALIRGLTRKNTDKIGNFWVDMTRATIYVLLPLSIILAVFLSSEGVIQNFQAQQTVETLSGGNQSIPMGPVASQIAIKQLGTNGGGFFNANSAHPFENPTPLSNLIEMLAILLIPASLTYTFGKMVGSTRQGWILFVTMLVLLLAGLGISLYSELASNSLYNGLSLMEGKETRFGVTNSVLWSTITTAASNGSVNAMADSLTPLSGLVCLLNIMLGEVVFGGVGSGLYGMVIFIILTVFIAGLMVGRTPEFLGKKVESFEVKMSILAILIPSFFILAFSSWAVISNPGLKGLGNAGPHGLTEILYAFTSASGNNGSAFAGLSTNTVFYNVTLGICMLMGRFGVIIPVLAIAGNMATKKITPVSSGTFRTDNILFAGLLILIILIIGGLTFFPALSFGPIVEQLLMNKHILF